jgi:tetrathionate reductase subunit B
MSRPTVSRRGLLKGGLLALPALAGSQVLSAWADAAGAPAVEATETADPTAYDPSAHDWAFACDTTKCIGCGLCVEACKVENGVPVEPEYNRTWIERHLVAQDGTVYVDAPEGGIHGFPPESTAEGADEVTARKTYFVPRLCMQCDNPPCVSVCPVSATYKSEDGVVLVDAERCIGCGYCLVACPYGARYMVPAGGETPTGTAGVADKCTFCYHRITHGREPACVQVCPVGARVFGDLRDTESPVSAVLRDQRVRVLKPGLGTRPRVYYVGLESEVE